MARAHAAVFRHKPQVWETLLTHMDSAASAATLIEEVSGLCCKICRNALRDSANNCLLALIINDRHAQPSASRLLRWIYGATLPLNN